MKIAKREAQKRATEGAAEILKRRKFSPVDLCVDLYRESVPLPDDEGVLKSMLCTNWEHDPNAEGMLRPNLARRLEILKLTSGFAFPKLKATDGSGVANNGVIVQIKNYQVDQTTERGPMPIVTVRSKTE